jgi:hypothetical protein
LLNECIRIGLAEIVKREALISHVGRSDYNSPSIAGVDVADVDYALPPSAMGSSPIGSDENAEGPRANARFPAIRGRG